MPTCTSSLGMNSINTIDDLGDDSIFKSIKGIDRAGQPTRLSHVYNGGVSAESVAITLSNRSTLHGTRNKKENHLRGRVSSALNFCSLR